MIRPTAAAAAAAAAGACAAAAAAAAAAIGYAQRLGTHVSICGCLVRERRVAFGNPDAAASCVAPTASGRCRAGAHAGDVRGCRGGGGGAGGGGGRGAAAGGGARSGRGTRVVITASVLFPLDFDLSVAIARHHAREAEEAVVVLSCVHPLPDHRRAPRALPVALSKGGRRRQRWRGGGWRRDGLARLGLGDDLWVGQLADLALFRRRRIDQRAPWAAPTVQLVRFESRHALACRSSSWSVAGRSLFGGRAGLEAPRRRRGTWWRCRILARRRRTRSS